MATRTSKGGRTTPRRSGPLTPSSGSNGRRADGPQASNGQLVRAECAEPPVYATTTRYPAASTVASRVRAARRRHRAADHRAQRLHVARSARHAVAVRPCRVLSGARRQHRWRVDMVPRSVRSWNDRLRMSAAAGCLRAGRRRDSGAVLAQRRPASADTSRPSRAGPAAVPRRRVPLTDQPRTERAW